MKTYLNIDYAHIVYLLFSWICCKRVCYYIEDIGYISLNMAILYTLSQHNFTSRLAVERKYKKMTVSNLILSIDTTQFATNSLLTFCVLVSIFLHILFHYKGFIKLHSILLAHHFLLSNRLICQ